MAPQALEAIPVRGDTDVVFGWREGAGHSQRQAWGWRCRLCPVSLGSFCVMDSAGRPTGRPFLMNPRLRPWDGNGLKAVGRGMPFGFPPGSVLPAPRRAYSLLRAGVHGFLPRGLLVQHIWSRFGASDGGLKRLAHIYSFIQPTDPMFLHKRLTLCPPRTSEGVAPALKSPPEWKREGNTEGEMTEKKCPRKGCSRREARCGEGCPGQREHPAGRT